MVIHQIKQQEPVEVEHIQVLEIRFVCMFVAKSNKCFNLV